MVIDLLQSREKIDAIDKEIVELFERRMEIANDVAEYKLSTGKKVYDRERELQKLEALQGLASNDFNRHAVSELFTQIMSISRKWQYSRLASYNKNLTFEQVEKLHTTDKTKVAFFGEVGSYTEQAMEEFFGHSLDSISVTNFKEVMEMVSKEEVEFGVLPIENSSTGGISDIYDLLMEYENTIIGEHVVKVDHALLGIKGGSLEKITKVYSHPQALMQCKPFLEAHGQMKGTSCESTSSAAKKVHELGDDTVGAIGSKRAAALYDLEVMKESINKEEKNCTRFIIISKHQIFFEQAKKVSICFEIPHESGSLYSMLSHIIYNGLNMTKIESRPISGRTWEYRFFVEFEGNLSQASVRNALNGIKEEASVLRILGNFE